MSWLITTVCDAVGDAVGGKFAEKIVETFWSFGETEMSLLRSLTDDIAKLQRNHTTILATLATAEDRRRIEDEDVKRWLADLKSAAFDAADVLDTYHTLKSICDLKSQASNRDAADDDSEDEDEGQEATTGKRKRPLLGFLGSRKRRKGFLGFGLGFGWPRLPFLNSGEIGMFERRGIRQEIARIDDRLTEIAKDRKMFKLDNDDGPRWARLSAALGSAGAGYKEGTVIGREVERKKIVELLVNSSDGADLPVVGVHGVGGIGKTSLARLVFEDGDVVSYFDVRVWVSMGEGCGVQTVVEQMIEGISGRRAVCSSLDLLFKQLIEIIRGKKLLLVLDNLFGVDYRFWERLRVPLVAGDLEIKILVTARDRNVWRGCTMLDELFLRGLKEDDCWHLLREKAFPDDDWDRYPNLGDIGNQIVSRCQGSPSVAKFLGATLCRKSAEDEWSSILDEMWALKEKNNVLLWSLRISYHHLDFQQKQLFAYCASFPRGYEFDKEELVRLWIAEGLINPCTGRRLEAVGDDYFEVLCSRSFFELSDDEKHKYKMPNLIHDLARNVAKQETLVVEDNVIKEDTQSTDVQSAEQKQPRYASLLYKNDNHVEFQMFYQYPQLRAIKFHGKSQCLKEVPGFLFNKLKYLRVLDFSHSLVEELPDSIYQLTSLRFLGLRDTKVKRLPESVCNLYNLQTLQLDECDQLQKLPKNIINLVNLKHICLHLDWDKVKDGKLPLIPRGISSVSCLETLSRFPVGSRSGCRLSELKSLPLRGELCISQLENVVDTKYADEAKLGEKQYIKKLMLQWSNNDSVNTKQNMHNCEDITEKLRPHKWLEKLRVDNYPGSTFPNWLGDQSFSFLESVTLSFCRNLESFPLVGQLPQLKNLKVEGMDKVTSLGNTIGFPSLETLTLLDMQKLERLFDVVFGTIPKLQELVVKNCPKLGQVSDYLQPRSAKVKLSNCPILLDSDFLLSMLFVIEND